MSRWNNQTLICYCCREHYRRGEFRCCKAPLHMKPWRWLEQFCTACGKCPRHCLCEKPEPMIAPSRPLAALADQYRREWVPYPSD